MSKLAILFALILPIVGAFIYVFKYRPGDFVAITVLVFLTILTTIVCRKV